MKTAIIFGATGLVGNNLLNLLIADNYYSKIKIFVRNEFSIKNSKIQTTIIDFDKLENYSNLFICDDCFFCIGTTRKETPNINEYREVEFNIPVQIGKIVKKNNIKSFMYVSSLGATSKTNNLYLKNKGEAAEVLENLKFPNLSIIRPSLLLGPRNSFRFSEFILQKLFKNLFFLFQGSFKKYRAIYAEDVAKAMLYISKNNLKNINFDSDYLFELSKKN